MNRLEADILGRDSAKAFTKAYESLLSHGHYDSARALMLSSFPFALALVAPSLRSLAIADLIDVYYMVGKEVFEDGQDLYDMLTKKHGE